MTTFTLDDDKPVLFQKLIEAEIEEKVRRAENEYLMKLKEEQVSISSTLKKRVLCTNVVLAAFYIHAYVEKSCQNDVCMIKTYVKCR